MKLFHGTAYSVLSLMVLSACNQQEPITGASSQPTKTSGSGVKEGDTLSREQIIMRGGDADAPVSEEIVKSTKVTLATGEIVEMQYVERNGYAIAEGDILLGKIDRMGLAKASSNVGNGFTKWPSGVIPYELVTTNTTKLAWIKNAMNYWMANTNIRFVKKHNGHSNWVKFRDAAAGEGCSSYLGMVSGAQDLTVTGDCKESGLRHEIGHAVGLHHEHSRQDRGSWVTLYNEAQFCRVPFNGARNLSGYGTNEDAWAIHNGYCPITGTQFGSYDLASLMHYPVYPNKRFCLNNAGGSGCTVLDFNFNAIPAKGNLNNSGLALSANDIAAVSSLYFGGSPNADTKADLQFYEPSNTNSYLAASTGTVFSSFNSPWASGIPANRMEKIIPGDFNGDAMTDLGYQAADGAFWVFLSTGLGYAAKTAWIQPGTFGHDNGRFYAGDFNGDGRCDLVFFDAGNKNLVFAKSTGLTFAGGGIWGNNSAYTVVTSFFPGDYNGDGICDIGYFGTNKNFLVSISSGIAFGFPGTWLNGSYYGYGNVTPFVGDFTGDGRDDVLMFVPIENTMRMHAAINGGGFAIGQTWVTSNSFGGVAGNFYVGDFTGDNRTDLAYFEPAGSGAMYVRATNSSGSGLNAMTTWISGWGHNNGRFYIGHKLRKRVNI